MVCLVEFFYQEIYSAMNLALLTRLTHSGHSNSESVPYITSTSLVTWKQRSNLRAMKGYFKTLWVYWRDCDTIVLEHLMATYRTLGTKYKLSGSSGDWCGIAWNPVEEDSGEALLQQNGGSCE